MKKLFAVITAVLIASAAVVFASGDLTYTPLTNFHGNSQVGVQFFAPDGSATSSLAVNSSTVDLSKYILYSAWSASGTCFERAMPASNSTKSSYKATPIPNTSWHTRGVNPATAFVNFSGCVGGFLKKQ